MWRACRCSDRLEPLALLLVGRTQLFVADLHGRGDVGQRELDVLEVDGFRRLIARLIVLVACRDGGVVDRDARAERLEVEQRVRDLAPLVVELDIAAELGRRQERRVDDAVLQIADLEALARQRSEHRRCKTLIGENADSELVRDIRRRPGTPRCRGSLASIRATDARYPCSSTRCLSAASRTSSSTTARRSSRRTSSGSSER